MTLPLEQVDCTDFIVCTYKGETRVCRIEMNHCSVTKFQKRGLSCVHVNTLALWGHVWEGRERTWGKKWDQAFVITYNVYSGWAHLLVQSIPEVLIPFNTEL